MSVLLVLLPIARDTAYIVTGQDAVEKLKGADGDKEAHEAVEELCALGGLLVVVVDQVQEDLVPVVDAGGIAALL